MRARTFIVPVAAFLIAYGVVRAWRGPVAKGSSGDGASMAARSAGQRESSGEASSMRPGPLAEVMRKLRAGDPEGAREAFRAAAQASPEALLRSLREMPYLDGVDGAVAAAAARLTYDSQESQTILSLIGPPKWRISGWDGFLAAGHGRKPDVELLELAREGEVLDRLGDCRLFLAAAADGEPVDFMAALIRMQISPEVCALFNQEAVRRHPELASAMLDKVDVYPAQRTELFDSMLQSRAAALPTVENYQAAMKDAGREGQFATSEGTQAMTAAFGNADAGQQEQLISFILAQDELSRNRLLGAIAESSAYPPIAADRLTSLVGQCTSVGIQEKMLTGWMDLNEANLDPADRGWIDKLPTDPLRNLADRWLDRFAESRSGK